MAEKRKPLTEKQLLTLRIGRILAQREILGLALRGGTRRIPK